MNAGVITDKRLFFVNSEEVTELVQNGFLVVDENNNGAVDDSDSVIVEKKDSYGPGSGQVGPPAPSTYLTVPLSQFRKDFFKGKLTVGMSAEIGSVNLSDLVQGKVVITPLPPSAVSQPIKRQKIYDVLKPLEIKPLVNTGNCPIDEEEEWKGPFSHDEMPIDRITVCPLTNSKDGRTDTYDKIYPILLQRVMEMYMTGTADEQVLAKKLIKTLEGGVAIYLYTTEAYQVINPMLRGEKASQYGIVFRDPRLRNLENSALRKILARLIKTMDKALDAINPYVGTVYRVKNLAPEDVRRFLAKYQVGKTVEEKGYLSTALDPKIIVYGAKEESFEARFEITSLSGKRIKYFSKYPKEEEILFKHDTRFVVEKVEVEVVTKRLSDNEKPDSSEKPPTKTVIRVKMKEVSNG